MSHSMLIYFKNEQKKNWIFFIIDDFFVLFFIVWTLEFFVFFLLLNTMQHPQNEKEKANNNIFTLTFHNSILLIFLCLFLSLLTSSYNKRIVENCVIWSLSRQCLKKNSKNCLHCGLNFFVKRIWSFTRQMAKITTPKKNYSLFSPKQYLTSLHSKISMRNNFKNFLKFFLIFFFFISSSSNL